MEIHTQGDVVRICGLERLSSANSMELKDLVTESLKAGRRIIEVDFANMVFVDSEGLGALIAIRRAAAAKEAKVRLMNPKPSVLQLLDLVQFRRIFEIVT